MENSFNPRIGEHVFEEADSLLTMTGDVGTEAGNPTLIKKTGKIQSEPMNAREGFRLG